LKCEFRNMMGPTWGLKTYFTIIKLQHSERFYLEWESEFDNF
jgi:hypothetical protein